MTGDVHIELAAVDRASGPMRRVALAFPFMVSAPHLTAWADAFPAIPSRPETFLWRQVAEVAGIPVELEELRAALDVAAQKGGNAIMVAPARDGSSLKVGGVKVARSEPASPFIVKERRAYAHEQLPLLMAG